MSDTVNTDWTVQEHAPQWLHFLDRVNSTLNSLSHFLHDSSLSLYSGGGPLSSGMPATLVVIVSRSDPSVARQSAGGAEARRPRWQQFAARHGGTLRVL